MRWSVEKYRIVMEVLTTSAETVEICREYGLSPTRSIYGWRSSWNLPRPPWPEVEYRHNKTLQKENDHLKTLLAESTLAVAALKKPWRRGSVYTQVPNTVNLDA